MMLMMVPCCHFLEWKKLSVCQSTKPVARRFVVRCLVVPKRSLIRPVCTATIAMPMQIINQVRRKIEDKFKMFLKQRRSTRTALISLTFRFRALIGKGKGLEIYIFILTKSKNSKDRHNWCKQDTCQIYFWGYPGPSTENAHGWPGAAIRALPSTFRNRTTVRAGHNSICLFLPQCVAQDTV